MSELIQATTDQTFEQDVLKSGVPVIVDLWAPWCGPCKVIHPILEEIAQEVGDKVKIVKLNVDENPQTAAKFGVMNIPTLIVFKGGQEADRVVGVVPKEELQKKVQKVIEG